MYNHIKEGGEKKYRHEWKHEIDRVDMTVLRRQLSAIAKPDSHTADGKYEIRSLYFDTITDRALREKIDGMNIREKFRLRYYNGDTSFIRLEKKCKINGLCSKESVILTKDQAEAIVNGDCRWMTARGVPLMEEFYVKTVNQGLRPKTIVDYTREPFVFALGNVRITSDYNIRTGMRSIDFLNPCSVTVPAGDFAVILEVKWDEYCRILSETPFSLKTDVHQLFPNMPQAESTAEKFI